MALILIAVEDRPDGNVEVALKMHPQLQGSETEFTAAQRVAAAGMNAIHDMVVDLKTVEIDLSMAPSAKDHGAPFQRKLTIVGADEAPL